MIDRKDCHAFRILSAEFLDDFFIQAADRVRPVVDATEPFEDRLQNLQIVVCGCFGRMQVTRSCDEVRDEDDAGRGALGRTGVFRRENPGRSGRGAVLLVERCGLRPRCLDGEGSGRWIPEPECRCDDECEQQACGYPEQARRGQKLGELRNMPRTSLWPFHRT